MQTTNTVHWNTGETAEDHNIREEELCSHEPHIDFYNEQGKSSHEVWLHHTMNEIYEIEFGDALANYNAKQKRADRQMTMQDYMKSVENDNRGKAQTKRVNGKRVVNENATRQGKQLCYEFTVKVGNTYRAKDKNGRTIYDENNHHVRPEELPRDLQRSILKRYYDSFQDANPNLRLKDACFHADEGFYNKRQVWEYSEDHLHMVVVPVAEGFTRGLSKQNSMNKAMLAMGFDTPNCYNQWAKSEQKRLEKITYEEYEKYCEAHPDFFKTHGDLAIYHPIEDKTREGGKSKEEFARSQELDEDIFEAEVLVTKYKNKVAGNDKKLKSQQAEIEMNDRTIEAQKILIADTQAQADKYAMNTKAIADQYAAEKKANADKEYEKALISSQLLEKEYSDVEEYKIKVGNLQRIANKRIVKIDAMTLSVSEYFESMKDRNPELYHLVKLDFEEYKRELKKTIEVQDIEVPQRTEININIQMQRTDQSLIEIQEEYKEPKELDKKLKRNAIPVKQLQIERELPKIKKESDGHDYDNKTPD
ncbi:MAG: hypothetical protein K5888_11830 [Lachnospiraceae bacterium]|nr:hypothetical protein [Lachnospiraceae bacterium]